MYNHQGALQFKLFLNSILSGISLGSLTLLLQVDYSNKPIVILSVILSILTGFTVTLKYMYQVQTPSMIQVIISLYFSIRMCVQLYRETEFSILVIASSLWALFLIFLIIIQYIWKLSYCSFSNMDSYERHFLKYGIFLISVAVATLYSLTKAPYSIDDHIFSIDSGPLFYEQMPSLKMGNNTIRHILLSAVRFPIWRLLKDICIFFNVPDVSLTLGILLALVNGLLLLLTAILLKRISGNQWIPIIYMFTSPVILFTLFIEKYQLATFLIVLSVYLIINNKKGKGISAMIATGVMSTSAILLPFIYSNKSKPLKIILKEYSLWIVKFLLFIIISGKLYLIYHGISETIELLGYHAVPELSLRERGCSWVNMIHSCFLALPTEINNQNWMNINWLWWRGLNTNFSLISIFLLMCIILIIIMRWHDIKIRICSSFVILSFFMFYLVGWSGKESPLFALYFSWAYLLILDQGLNNLLKKMNCEKFKSCIYSMAILIMISINVPHLFIVIKYARDYFPY